RSRWEAYRSRWEAYRSRWEAYRSRWGAYRTRWAEGTTCKQVGLFATYSSLFPPLTGKVPPISPYFPLRMLPLHVLFCIDFAILFVLCKIVFSCADLVSPLFSASLLFALAQYRADVAPKTRCNCHKNDQSLQRL